MRRFALLLVSFVLVSSVAHADYAAGLRAYQAKDYVAAFSEWISLAGQGDVKAQTAIGSLFLTGRGVDRDYAEAARWYQKAADQGYSLSQNYLAYRYLKGQGVPQNYVMAEMWFSLSGPGTDQEDAQARAEAAAHLTPEQMSQALRLAQEWRANRPASTARAANLAPAMPATAAPLTPAAMPARYTWTVGAPGCEQRWIEGILAEIVNLPSLQATVSLRETPDGLFVAVVGIRNLSTGRIDVLPFNFSIQMTNPQGKRLAALPPEKAMAKQSLAQTIAAAIAGGAQGWSDASQKRTASATVTNPDGTTSQVDIYATGPTQQEIDQRNRAAQDRRDEAVARDRFNQGIRGVALAATTLDPQREVNGAVWFPREKKKYREVVIAMPIGGTVIEFPFQFR